MFHHANEPDATSVDEFVESAQLGRLVTVGPEATPAIGLFPFVWSSTTAASQVWLEVHLNREDEQLAHLRSSPRCVFEVDEVLTTIPSSWLDAGNARMATAFHRAIVFECEAHLHPEPAAIAATLNRIMARYQPRGGHEPVDHLDPMYSDAIETLVCVRLHVSAVRAKFKLHQDRSPEAVNTVIARLRRRRARNDDYTAGLLNRVSRHHNR